MSEGFTFTFRIYDQSSPCDVGQLPLAQKLDPVGSTVRYEVMKLCTGSVLDSNGQYLAVLSQYEAVIDVIGSVEGIDAFIY